jgi:hypothetical protein
MSLQEIVVMIHNGEYGRAISSLEYEAKDEGRAPLERIECCGWLAECNLRLEDRKTAGDWYLEAVKLVLSLEESGRAKAHRALPLCDKALECYRQEGDSADVLVAARLRQYLLGLGR